MLTANSMNRHGFVRLSAACLRSTVANPAANADEIIRVLSQVSDSDVVVFPELCVTAYTCADLFGQRTLLDAGVEQTRRVAAATRGRQQLVLVGLPFAVENGLFNCAAALFGGEVLGLVPKQAIPTYKEFYEGRWFQAATGSEPPEVDFGGQAVPFGVDLLFQAGPLIVGVEICEDLWIPAPPSAFQAVAGANVLVNLSASNETIGKNKYRTDLVVGQSGRCMAAYVYAGAGPTESTTDLVFGGHCLIAENGALLAESSRVGDGGPLRRDSYFITADADLDRLQSDRRTATSFQECAPRLSRRYRIVPFSVREQMDGLHREISGTPFVPGEKGELERRCAEIFGVQCAGLARRIEQLPSDLPLCIGVSGGLDSTLSLLVAVKMCDALKLPRSRIHGLTMPGFGTSEKTRTNAVRLMEHLGVSSDSIDIRPLTLDAFRAMGHRPFGLDPASHTVEGFQQALGRIPAERCHDLVFENVQARIRTLLLMSRGFVIGTGDLSELALGWSTYNADHMSMYNPNCSIPKTLVRFLVRYVAEHEFEGSARQTLLSVVETPISPELLPLSPEGESRQSTEESLGPYELHDFFLFHFVRNGFAPEKILFLAAHADSLSHYSPETIAGTLRTFYRRFFANQFKRSCLPDGPKVGTVSLSPRGDWRMPSDANPDAWRF